MTSFLTIETNHWLRTFVEYRNIETFLGRISSLYRRAKTKICDAQTTCSRKIKWVCASIVRSFSLPFLFRANGEIERLRRTQSSEMEGVQAQLRYSQLRVQSLEQELKSAKLELEQKVNNKIKIVLLINFVLVFSRKKKISN